MNNNIKYINSLEEAHENTWHSKTEKIFKSFMIYNIKKSKRFK